MRQILVLLLISAMSVTAPAQENSKSYDENVARVLAVVKKLSELAIDPATIEARTNAKSVEEFLKLIDPIQKQIDEQVETINDPHELETLGLICRGVLYPQKAKEVSYDRILEWAYWHCVTLLARDSSSEAAQSLERLKRKSYLFDDEYRLFEELVSEGAKRRGQTKKPK